MRDASSGASRLVTSMRACAELSLLCYHRGYHNDIPLPLEQYQFHCCCCCGSGGGCGGGSGAGGAGGGSAGAGACADLANPKP